MKPRMNSFSFRLRPYVLFFLVVCLSPFLARTARAECANRVSVGAGIVHRDTPSETKFTAGAVYECRLNAFWGVGGFFNHVFADPGFSVIGAPQLLLHPLGGDFFVAASPILEFGDRTGTHAGVRLSSRVPLPLGLFILVPSVAVDFINGGRHYWFSLGLQF